MQRSLTAAWVLLALVAALAFVACGTGAIACTIGRPIGLVAALAAAGISVFDAPSPRGR